MLIFHWCYSDFCESFCFPLALHFIGAAASFAVVDLITGLASVVSRTAICSASSRLNACSVVTVPHLGAVTAGHLMLLFTTVVLSVVLVNVVHNNCP